MRQHSPTKAETETPGDRENQRSFKFYNPKLKV